jgi:hypothetical protein
MFNVMPIVSIFSVLIVFAIEMSVFMLSVVRLSVIIFNASCQYSLWRYTFCCYSEQDKLSVALSAMLSVIMLSIL